MVFKESEDSVESFKASGLAKWFHYSPHRDFQFDATTTIFTPSDKSYNEALFMLAIFIAAFGVFLFIALLTFYTCCFCLCTKPARLTRGSFYSRKKCYQTSIFVLGLICCSAIIVGFVFNGQTSDGVDDFHNAVDEIQKDIHDAYSMGGILQRTLRDGREYMNELPQEETEAQEAVGLTNEMLIYLDNINGLIPDHVGNGGSDFGGTVHHYDNFRWLVAVSVFTWSLFLCIFCFWVCFQTAGCIMVMLTIFSFSAMILTWVVMGAHFGIATGTGDFCVNPGSSIKNMSGRSNPADSVVIDYYLKCPSQDSPFDKNMTKFQATLETVTKIIKEFQGRFPGLTGKILTDLQFVKSHLSIYQEEYSCPKVHKAYMEAMDGLCNKALVGLAVVILTFFIVGVLSGLLTCCLCPLWGFRKSYYLTYPNVEAVVGDGENGVLFWPDGLDNNFDYNRWQALNEDETRLIGYQQPPANNDYENNPLLSNPNEIATTSQAPNLAQGKVG